MTRKISLSYEVKLIKDLPKKFLFLRCDFNPTNGTEILSLPEDPVFGTWYCLCFFNFFKVSTMYQMQLQNFSKILGTKNRYLDRYRYPKETFFEFFSSISWGLCTGTKGKKVVLFGFSTSTKGESRIFEE
jgi:hypothetical protein